MSGSFKTPNNHCWEGWADSELLVISRADDTTNPFWVSLALKLQVNATGRVQKMEASSAGWNSRIPTVCEAQLFPSSRSCPHHSPQELSWVLLALNKLPHSRPVQEVDGTNPPWFKGWADLQDGLWAVRSLWDVFCSVLTLPKRSVLLQGIWDESQPRKGEMRRNAAIPSSLWNRLIQFVRVKNSLWDKNILTAVCALRGTEGGESVLWIHHWKSSCIPMLWLMPSDITCFHGTGTIISWLLVGLVRETIWY